MYLLQSLCPSCWGHCRWSLIICLMRRNGLRGHECIVFTEIFFLLQNIFLLSVLEEGREEACSWLLLPPAQSSIIFLLEYFRVNYSKTLFFKINELLSTSESIWQRNDCLRSLSEDGWLDLGVSLHFFFYALHLKLKDFSINIFLLLNTITNITFISAGHLPPWYPF